MTRQSARNLEKLFVAAGRRPGRVALWLIGAVVILLPASRVAAEGRFFEQEPFDQITLNAANDNAVLRVLPSAFPDRTVPKLRPSQKIVVHLQDQPDTAYELQWGSVEKVELFEAMVLAEAVKLVKAGRYDEGYDYFDFLQRQYPNLDGLSTAVEDYLYEQAKALHVDGQYDAALAMLRELHERNKSRSELERALGLTTEELVKKYVAAKDYESARTLLRNLGAWYPEHATVAKWEGQFRDEAAKLQTQAQTALTGGDLRQAEHLSRQIMRIWPTLPGAAELREKMRAQFPRVVVGVTVPSGIGRPGSLDDWAARRSGRLLYRTLMEFVGPGTDGGRYRCPIGNMATEELGRRLAFQVRPGVHWATGPETLTGYDLSRQLLAMADPDNPAYRYEWGELLDNVAVRNVYQVDANLRRTHVRPEALLQTILVPYADVDDFGSGPLTNGPYTVVSRSDEEVCYVANPQYFDAGQGTPKEIVERTFARGADAIRQLKQGRIEMIDRLNPWEIERLDGDADVVVEPYGVPLVHVIIPNLSKPLLAHRRFRRALVYGLNRDVLLRHVTGGREIVGCRVLSGPFPDGITHDDPLGYAYDRSIKPRPYDPHLALALAKVAVEEVAAAEKKRGNEWKGLAPLVMAHPPGELFRSAAKAIQQQWKLVGIPVEPREVTPAEVAKNRGAYDLVYAEWAVWEPVVDAVQLLGEHGPAGGCSPYMSLVLSRLQQATDWKEVHRILPQVHRIAHDDASVVPLWQMVDQMAYRKTLRGVGARPVLPYQNVEQWQTAGAKPAEKP